MKIKTVADAKAYMNSLPNNMEINCWYEFAFFVIEDWILQIS